MLSWIFDSNTYTPHESPNAFSGAGTEFIDIPSTISDGGTGRQTAHEAISRQPPQQALDKNAHGANESSSLNLHDERIHHCKGRERQLGRSQQKALDRGFSPQPLPLYGTFDGGDCNPRTDTRRQHGNGASPFCPACSGTQYSASGIFSSGSGAPDRRRGSGHGVPSLARQIPERRDGRDGRECTAGGAFLHTPGRRGEEEEGEVGEQVSFEDQGFFGLDGGQDQSQNDGAVRGREKSVRVGKQSVRERVAKLEATSRKAVVVPASRKEALDKSTVSKDGGGDEKVPIVYPLRYKRFARRTSSGTPVLRPDTPLYRSQPDGEQMLHAPRPTRSFPVLRTPPETPKPVPTTIHGTRNLQREDAHSRISPASFLHGTRSNCVRHGKRKQQTKAAGGTRDMVEKSGRSGAYIPTGLTSLRQMEATSPWVTPLTKADAATKKAPGEDDACPDCVGELGIKRRELFQGSGQTVQRPTATTSSNVAAPEKTRDIQSHDLSEVSEDEGLVIAKDLGEGLDAVIVEHRGDLRRVVLNTRHGRPTIETMQRLSRELAKVSNEIAFAGVQNPSGSTQAKGARHEYALVLNTLTPQPAKQMRNPSPSVPELLDLVDQAANEIHLNTGKLADHYVDRRDFAAGHGHDQSLLSHSEFDDVVQDGVKDNGLVTSQSIDDQYRDLRQQLLVNGSSKMDGNVKKAENPAKGQSSAAQPAPPSKDTTPYSMPSSVIDPSLVKATPSKDPRPQARPDKAVGQHPAPSTNQPSSTQAAKPNTDIPQILTTKPTLPLSASGAKPQDISPTQTPPPEHPSLHHSTEIGAKTTPRPQHSNPFAFRNPFHYPPGTTTTTQAPQPAITNQANPYHHAPHTPLDIDKAAYADPKVREHQQAIRAAMRMERDRVVQNASAVEREARRKRSLVGRKNG